MDISKIDKNFAITTITETDIKWKTATDKDFALYGVFYDEDNERFARMPQNVADKVSPSVSYLASMTACGRIKFKTDSPYIALRAVVPTPFPMDNMCLLGQSGFTVYIDGYYRFTMFLGSEKYVDALKKEEPFFAFEGIYHSPVKATYDVEIYFPLYNGVKEFYIGLQEGSACTPVRHKNDKMVVFYGSSITEGGCCTQPGNSYINMLERELDINAYNLGFSGCCQAEDTMINYLAELDPLIYVLDYDHNAADENHLRKTHFKLYDTLRKAHPTTPIIIITKPDFDSNVSFNTSRRKVIYETYLKAKANGDKLVEFIDGEKLFGSDHRECCTVDTCHPNELGFYRMAMYIKPYIKKYL